MNAKQLNTMSDVEDVILEHRAALAEHEFIRLLDGDGTLTQVLGFMPRLAGFVMCFQDVLRLAYERCREPALKELAREHRLEDQGHDLWYLHDAEKLGVKVDVPWMFSDAHQLTRDVAYSQIAAVLTAQDDRTRLAIVLALEAIGAEFFKRVIGFLERNGKVEGLRYFSHSHRLIEASHQVFEEASQARLAQLEVPASARPEILNAVAEVFAGMSLLAADCAAAMRAKTPES